MAVGNAAVDLATAPGFLEHVNKIANYLNQQLGALVAAHPAIFEGVRGQGMMLGLKMKVPNGDFITAARGVGIVVLPADKLLSVLSGSPNRMYILPRSVRHPSVAVVNFSLARATRR